MPTGQQVTVKSAAIQLPFLSCKRTATIQGDPSVKLESYEGDAPFQLDQQTLTRGEDKGFPLPPAQADCG